MDTAYVLAFILIMIRMSTFFMVVPVFFPQGTPNLAKVGLSVIISFILAPVVDFSAISIITSDYQLIAAITSEVTTGLILGFLTKMCFDFIRMAGSFMDFHVGFSMSNMFDPLAQENVTLIGKIMYWFGLILFLEVDGHHILIRCLINSFEYVKLGNFMLSNESIMLVVEAFVNFFELGVKISIPITFIILMTNLVLGLIARSVPQINVMILGLPIKILVGLVSLSLALPMLMKMIGQGFDQIPDLFDSFFKTAPLMFIFADSGGDKTEEATPKKKSDAKKKGQVARSRELSLAFSLLICALIITTFGENLLGMLRDSIYLLFNNYMNIEFTYNSVANIFIFAVYRIMMVFLICAVPIMLIGIGVNYMQTGFIFTTEPLKPDLKKLNPISGFKKLFSVRSLFQLAKSLVIVTILGFVGYKYLSSNYKDIINLGNLRLQAIPSNVMQMIGNLFFQIALIMIVIAVIDYVFQKRQHNKDLKMTKQEIKEEFKQSEGDPQIKSKIKDKQREIAMQRMMQSVPDATVVVTNPTHFAVALRYDDKIDEAPVVLAKGADYVSFKIKEVAKNNEIPIIENKPLARLLYSEVEIGQEVPSDMYEAIAEILAVVYKLNSKK